MIKVGTYEENNEINEILQQSSEIKDSFIFVTRQTFLNDKKDKEYSKEGLLEKLSPQTILVGYQRRFVILQKRELIYYEMTKQGDMRMCGAINFDLYSVRLEVIADLEGFRLHLLNCDRNFTFRPIQNQNSQKEVKDWINAIEYQLEGSHGKIK